jgi:hypothetical protein
MNVQRGPYYITYDLGWAMPRCKERPAIGQGWLFKESPLAVLALAKRMPIGENFIHSRRRRRLHDYIGVGEAAPWPSYGVRGSFDCVE